MTDLAKITKVEEVGEDKFFQATISFRSHSDAILVLGDTLDVCVRRAVIITEAFNKPKRGDKA